MDRGVKLVIGAIYGVAIAVPASFIKDKLNNDAAYSERIAETLINRLGLSPEYVAPFFLFISVSWVAMILIGAFLFEKERYAISIALLVMPFLLLLSLYNI